MRVELTRCSACGGGPVSPTEWERTPYGPIPVKSRCNNCGRVEELDDNERHVVETV